MYSDELENAKERLGVTQAAVNKAGDNAKTAKKKAFGFEADHVAEVGSRRAEVGTLTMQLRQQNTFAAARLMSIAAVHAKLASHKAKQTSWMRRIR